MVPTKRIITYKWYSAAFEKESSFVKNKAKEAEKVPEGADPFATW